RLRHGRRRRGAARHPHRGQQPGRGGDRGRTAGRGPHRGLRQRPVRRRRARGRQLNRVNRTRQTREEDNPMLEMRQVSKVYRTELVETHALRALDLHVRDGEFVAVTGPSGSGKTTFLNIAGLLETFTGGEYLLDGEDVRGLSDDARSKLRNRKIGFIIQSFNLIPDLNLFDNCDEPLRYGGMAAAERREPIEQGQSPAVLGVRMKHYPAELPGGLELRAAIARALAGRPRLLLAYEPSGSHATQMARGVMEQLVEIYGQGATIPMVTHHPELDARAQ